MALNSQKIDLVFTQGLNTKTDSKTTLSTSLQILENAVFTKQGALNKRYGYTALGNNTCSGNATLTDTKALMTFQEDELLLATSRQLYSYSESTSKWINKDSFISASTELESVVSNSSEQTAIDSATNNGVTIYAWEDTRGGIRYSVQDESTGSYFISDEELVASGDTPRCIAVGSNLLVFYGNSTNLSFKYVSVGDPCTLSAGSNLRTDLHTDHLFDMVSVGGAGYVFYKTTTAATGALVKFTSTGALSNLISLASYTIVDTLAIAHYASANVDYLNLVYKQDANTVRCAIYTAALGSIVAAKDLDATASTDISKLTLARTDSATDQVTVFYQSPGASAANDFIRKNTLDLDGTVGTPSIFIRSLGLASKAFNNSDGDLFVSCLHDSDLQATVFTLDANAETVCKFSAGNAGTHAAIGAFLPNTMSLGGGVYGFAINTKGRIRSENAVIFSRLGVSKATVDFAGRNTYTNSQLNQNLFVVGGILHSYDSKSVTEQGFHLYPESTNNSSNPTTGGFLSDGTYGYAVVYQWIDAKGNRQISAPEYITVTLSGGTSTQKPVLDIPTLRVTKKTGTNPEVTCEVYRTEADGTIYYRVTSISSPLVNDPTVDTVTFNDTAAADPTGNEILYTTGGVLENISAPSCDLITVHQNRLFIAGLENKNEIRYSKAAVTGESTAFNEALSLLVEPRGGDITQIASMDSFLVVFKKNNIYIVQGDVPDDLGQDSTLNDPRLISTDVGCTNPGSVTLGAEGLYFKSAKGIYLLTRGLQVVYVGAPVEDYNSLEVVSSKLLDDSNEVRFATSSGVTLVYNYYFSQWSVFTGQNSVDSVIWQDQYTFLSTSNSILKEDKTTFRDDGSNVKMRIATGWVSLTGLQGYQRCRRAVVLGEYKSRHILRLSHYTDYSPILRQTSEFTTSAALGVDSDYYGDGTYGEMELYGGDSNGVYQFETHLKTQKCQTVRFVIEDVIDNSVDIGEGESFSITGLTLQIGAKQGFNKNSITKKN